MKAIPLCGVLCLAVMSSFPNALAQTSTNSGVQAIRRGMEQLRQDYLTDHNGFTYVSLARSAAPAEQREIAEEAFAARAANIAADRANNTLVTSIEFAAQEARIVRLVIRRPHAGAPCIDELEVYGPNSLTNLALASRGAVGRASSVLPGYAIHAVAHLNDGLYGNDNSWISATEGEEWAQIELPAAALVGRVVISRDRTGQFSDRQILEAEVRLSSDGQTWVTAVTLKRPASALLPPRPLLTFPVTELSEPTWTGAVK
jgi:hypothetical protein